MTNIPSDEDFARAKRLMREESRGLDEVCESVKQRFKDICPLHNVYVLPQRDVNFRAYVFFCKDKDIKAMEQSGVVQQLIDSIYEELEGVGRGKREEITVAFEFDSDENVAKNFEGDYFMRLR